MKNKKSFFFEKKKKLYVPLKVFHPDVGVFFKMCNWKAGQRKNNNNKKIFRENNAKTTKKQMSLLNIVTKIAKRQLDEDELYQIGTFETKIRKLDEFIKDSECGNLLKQGKIKGSYNGYICPICSNNRAKWDCKKCGHYYCLDHIHAQVCNDCHSHCMACVETKEESELKFCLNCRYYLCKECDPLLWTNKIITCSECNLDETTSQDIIHAKIL